MFRKEVLLKKNSIAGRGSPKSHTAKTCGMSVSEGWKGRLTKGGMLPQKIKIKTLTKRGFFFNVMGRGCS